jgi:hypothetical protein
MVIVYNTSTPQSAIENGTTESGVGAEHRTTQSADAI